MELAFYWLIEIPVSTTAELVGVTRATAIQWYQYCRDICSTKMLALQQQLGGPGHIVQIDETLMFKRKYHVGHAAEQHWVFGMYDSHSRKGYCLHVQDRSAATLIPIIQQWVAPGSTIYSDQWASYNGLAALGFTHMTVNHQTNFVDPITQACTNQVEAFWSRLKRRLKYISGSVGEMRWSHLDEACY
ncbi:uncharacterized protein DEA37_0006204, partial [Paragonimus westermani]